MADELPGAEQPRIEIAEDERPSGGSASDGQAPGSPGLPAKHPEFGAYCSGCGSPIHAQAVVCPRCGVATANAAHTTGAAVTAALGAKSSGVAILLSLLFTGAGQWYAGRIGRGFAFLAAAVVSGILILAVVGLIALPIVWIWAAIDANKCVQEHNSRLMSQIGVQVPPAALGG